MNQVHYKKSQFGILITVVLCLVSVVTICFYVTQMGENPVSNYPIIGLIIIFGLLILCFYKLTITITDTKIEAKFGIGLIKRSLAINDIKFETITKINIPALYGIGIRFTPYGILYNVKLGEAIKIESADKTFFVGTDEAEEIHKTLLKLKPLQD